FLVCFYFFFFLIVSPPPVIYTLSLHDALPISPRARRRRARGGGAASVAVFAVSSVQEARAVSCQLTAMCRRRVARSTRPPSPPRDRKSTRLNSSHVANSYAVFCLKKKKIIKKK